MRIQGALEHLDQQPVTRGNRADALIELRRDAPGWFKVPTPLGTYNPDWAVLATTPDGDKLYFVAETKRSLFANDLRDRESAKIECGRAHFHALAVGENSARAHAAWG